jgi:hypothetical protein
MRRQKFVAIFFLFASGIFVVLFSGCTATSSGSNAIEIDSETGEIIEE